MIAAPFHSTSTQSVAPPTTLPLDHSATLPLLSPADRSLFNLFTAHNLDIPALARHTARTPAHLVLSRPSPRAPPPPPRPSRAPRPPRPSAAPRAADPPPTPPRAPRPPPAANPAPNPRVPLRRNPRRPPQSPRRRPRTRPVVISSPKG